MRIGLIHNYYRSEIPSGENLTVNQIATYLKDLGHIVSIYSESSDRYKKNPRLQIARVLSLFFGISKREFKEWISEQDAIQIHNYFPLIGRPELRVMLKSNIPITRVIHNYRKSCLSGNHFRKNNNCQRCTLNKFKSGIIRKCYEKSFLKSFVVSKMTKAINNFEINRVSKFVAVSQSIKKYLLDIGVESEKIVVIANGIAPLPRISKNAKEVLFVARLEPEKGTKLVIETWREYQELPRLNMVGTGSLHKYVSASTANLNNVIFHGALDSNQLELIAAKCRIFLAPLSWDEPFGRTLVEALSRGQAIVTTKKGIAEALVQEGVNGFFCEARSDSLFSAITRAQEFDYLLQLSVSIGIWENLFSTNIIEQNWKKFYENLE